ncbi:MAG TPA: hypothetical protein VG944_09890 [Fimbriimonas sp.]|nr:hypothetical protein [Fimbriimonas sp.]
MLAAILISFLGHQSKPPATWTKFDLVGTPAYRSKSGTIVCETQLGKDEARLALGRIERTLDYWSVHSIFRSKECIAGVWNCTSEGHPCIEIRGLHQGTYVFVETANKHWREELAAAPLASARCIASCTTKGSFRSQPGVLSLAKLHFSLPVGWYLIEEILGASPVEEDLGTLMQRRGTAPIFIAVLPQAPREGLTTQLAYHNLEMGGMAGKLTMLHGFRGMAHFGYAVKLGHFYLCVYASQSDAETKRNVRFLIDALPRSQIKSAVPR